jgi:hypothetical protein
MRKAMKNSILISMLVCAFMAFQQNMTAQTSEKDVTKKKQQTSIYAELFGTSILYSINAEQRWQLNSNSQLGVRVGFSAFKGGFFSDIERVYVPILLNYSLSMGASQQHFIEFGAGAQIADLRGYSVKNFFESVNYYNATYVLPTASLNYRYQNPKGFMLKAGLTPTFRYTTGIVGLSVGYTF